MYREYRVGQKIYRGLAKFCWILTGGMRKIETKYMGCGKKCHNL